MYYGTAFGALSADDTTLEPPLPPQETPIWVPVLLTGLLVVAGFAVYANYKVSSKIVEKEGARGLLGYEAGRTGLSMLERASR
jgi:hypothetical protein